jgi:hypothetical protein
LRKRRRGGARPIRFKYVCCKIGDGEFARAALVKAEVYIGDSGTRRGATADNSKVFVPAFAQVESSAQPRPNGVRTCLVERVNNTAHVVLNTKVSGESGGVHGKYVTYIHMQMPSQLLQSVRVCIYIYNGNVPQKRSASDPQTL